MNKEFNLSEKIIKLKHYFIEIPTKQGLMTYGGGINEDDVIIEIKEFIKRLKEKQEKKIDKIIKDKFKIYCIEKGLDMSDVLEKMIEKEVKYGKKRT